MDDTRLLLRFCKLNPPPSSAAERSDHQPRYRPLPGGGDVQRGQLRPAAGGPAVLRPEVDDPQLDQAPQALRPPPPREKEPERVGTALLAAGLAEHITGGEGEGLVGWAVSRVRAALMCPQAAQTGSRQPSLQEEDDQYQCLALCETHGRHF